MVVLQKSHTRSLPLTRIRWSSVMHRQPLTSSFWAKPAIEGEAIIWSSTPIFSLIMTWRTQMNIQDHLFIHDSFNFLTSTRPKPAYGRHELQWDGPGFSSGRYILGFSQCLASWLRCSAQLRYCRSDVFAACYVLRWIQFGGPYIFWKHYRSEQGNYSLRRPPKLIIPKIFTKQRWATVYRFMCNSICKSKQAYMTRAKVMSSLRDKINQKLLTFKRTPSPWPARCPQIWHLYVWPIYQHSHHHKSNCQKAWPACTQICHLCVLDPYSSIQTIIRVTAKKRDQLAPRFATSVCMTHIPTLTPS